MSVMPETCECSDTGELIGLLSEQRRLFGQLGQLAHGQRALIADDAPEKLLGVLGERQRVIDRLEDVSRQLRPYQQNWQKVRPLLGSADGERVDRLVNEVNVLLKGILEKDAADAELLAARKSEAARGVQNVKAARRAGTAYGGQPASGSRIDWTGE